MKQSRKKKRPRPSGKGNANAANGKDQKVLKNVVETFAEISMEDTNKAVGILPGTSLAYEDQSIRNFDVGSTSSSNGGYTSYEVGSSSSSNASMTLGVANDLLRDGMNQKSRPKVKKVVASAGCVSVVLGKDYVRSASKGSSKSKVFHEQKWMEEAEEFLCSVLGDDCELGMAVVSDVLCQCGYNVNKALDILLKLSASTKEQASSYCKSIIKEDMQHCLQFNNNLTDGTSDSTSHSSDSEPPENVWFSGPLGSNLFQSNQSLRSKKTRTSKSELPQNLLESLFSMPTPKSVEHEPNTMTWRNVVKKMTSLGPMSEPANNAYFPPIHAKEDEYLMHREAAQQHWASMKSYYQRAATAFANGEKEHASYLSKQGKLQNKLAQEADQRASQDIFAARNKSINNMITIDLHGQHVKQAMKLLKLHLLFGAYVRSVRSFRVITGCGSHGLGKSKLKNSVIDLLKREGISWSEENQGTLLIKLEGQTDFSFLDSGSDSDDD
ncbi:SMR domain-containing protein At5g58720 [Andrographis paniculata]|uniref:SMR domain-containing protein At5g58720 n=1 Tax=Andrographis paniculata TaxID=175694 RepID=UPI0021E7C2FB|nr:SMR domain-containing protein At5g58720 [Andrographis paniculata]